MKTKDERFDGIKDKPIVFYDLENCYVMHGKDDKPRKYACPCNANFK